MLSCQPPVDDCWNYDDDDDDDGDDDDDDGDDDDDDDDDDDEDDDDDPHRPVLEHLADVASAEPPLAALVEEIEIVEIDCRNRDKHLVEEILLGLLLVLEVPASNTGSTDHQLTPANWFCQERFLINKEQ